MICDDDAKRKIVNRLARANGQLNAVREMVENGGNCREVVQQLAAVSKALDRAGFLIIAQAMRECTVAEAEQEESDLTLDELEKLLLTLT